jgi:hypothetical protein
MEKQTSLPSAFILKRVMFSALLIWVATVTKLPAQSTIPASGGNASGSGGTVTYTIGQVLYNMYSGTNGSVAQGVQQPIEYSVVTGTEEAKDISIELMVYPNPATDYIKLKTGSFEIENLKYQLFDINGLILQDNIIETNETSISVHTLLPATYFLKLIHGNKVIKIFKIIKN